MKTLFAALLSILVLSACSDHETTYRIDSELDPYVSTFFDGAAQRGVNIPKNLVAELKQLQSTVMISTTDGQNELYFDRRLFNHYVHNNQEEMIEFYIFHSLGGLLLKRDKTEPDDQETTISIMNPMYFTKYKVSDREMLLDELFN